MAERVEELGNFIRGEIEGFKEGRIKSLATDEELRNYFGYSSVDTFRNTLRSIGLLEERRVAMQELGISTYITPSKDAAWILGVMSGGTDVNRRQIVLTSRHKELIDSFKEKGERIFGIQGLINNSSTVIRFYSRDITQALGSFGRTRWINTMNTIHSWVFDRPDFTWAYIEGLFEKRGMIQGGDRFLFNTRYQSAANFLSELFVRAGIKNPRITPNKKAPEGISGVGIYNLKDLRFLSEHIQSVIPKKEAVLAFYRISGNKDSFLVEDYSIYQGDLRLRKDGKINYVPVFKNHRFADLTETTRTILRMTIRQIIGSEKFSLPQEYPQKIKDEEEKAEKFQLPHGGKILTLKGKELRHAKMLKEAYAKNESLSGAAIAEVIDRNTSDLNQALHWVNSRTSRLRDLFEPEWTVENSIPQRSRKGSLFHLEKLIGDQSKYLFNFNTNIFEERNKPKEDIILYGSDNETVIWRN